MRLGDTDLWSASRRTARRTATSRSGATARPSGRARPRAGPARRSSTSSSSARSSSIPSSGVVKADIGIKDGRIVGIGRAGNPGDQRRHRAADRPAHPADHGLRPDRDARAPSTATSTSITPGARARGAVRRRHDAHHRGLRGAAVGDGPDARRASRTGRSTSACRPAPAPRTTARSRRCSTPARAASRSTRTTAPIPSSSTTSSVRRRARRQRLAPHRRPERVGGARGHGRRDRRPDGPRLSRRGQRRRPRAGRARPGPRAEHHLLVDDADHAVRRQRGRRAAADDRPQPRRVVRRRRGPRARRASGSTPATMAAEGPLHELGAIAIMNSDSQGMGRMWRRSGERSSSPTS